MADTRVQVQVERWVREVALPRRFGQSFTQKSVALTWGGRFIVDGVSDDGLMIACVSTAANRTATGRPAIGKYHKIRADALFLLHVTVPRRLLVFTEPAMYEHFCREQGRGRFPGPETLELLQIDLPSELRVELQTSRDVATREVSPKDAYAPQGRAVPGRTRIRTEPRQDADVSPSTERDQLESFLLAQRRQAFCDDCLGLLLRFRRRQNAQRVTAELGAITGYRREKGHCSHCDAHASGREKYVTLAI